jgi:hypothetical protein
LVELSHDDEHDAEGDDEPKKSGVIQAIFDYIFKF